MKRMTLATLATLLMVASTSFAATQATGTNSVAPTLQISATIQQAVSLTLATGTTAASHCAVTPNGGNPDYTMNFGTVDALGINAGNCNKFNPVTPGVTNAVYWTDYQLTPVYTSQLADGSSTITAQVTTDFAAPHNIFIVRDTANSSAVPAGVGSFSPMGVASADTIGAAGVVSGTALTRYVGVEITPASGVGTLQGLQTATVTFTLTVQ